MNKKIKGKIENSLLLLTIIIITKINFEIAIIIWLCSSGIAFMYPIKEIKETKTK